MTPRKNNAQREVAALPEVLIPPSEAKENEREAYWLELLADPERLRAAVETTPFFDLLTQLPSSLWGGRLSIYLYRVPDDDGLMVKTPGAGEEPGKFKFIKPVIRHVIDEEWVATKCGGGKYQAILKDYRDKERRNSYIQKYTFRIDGSPKVQPGQIVEIDGKPVNVGAPAILPPQADSSSSDVAKVIEATSAANKQNMEILAEGSKAAIQLVRDQVSSKPEAANPMMDKLLTVLVERALTPAPQVDVLSLLEKARTLFTPIEHEDAPEPKDPPLTQAMDLLEKVTGKSFSELTRGKSAPPAEASSPWIGIALGVAEKFFAVAPTLFQQATYAKGLEFQRAVWLRSAKPGEAPPASLMAATPPQLPPQPQQPANQNHAPNPPAPDPVPDAMQLVPHIVQMVCHGFDTKCTGDETAAAIVFNFREHIEAAGIDVMLADAESVKQLVEGNQLMKQRSTHAKWPQFQEEFLEYMADRFGTADADKQPAGPQPVA